MVPDYKSYSINSHAKSRLLTRFNLVKADLNNWLNRYLLNATYLRDDKNDKTRKLYALNDIIAVLDTKQKEIVTIWSQDRDDMTAIAKEPTYNPEVKSAINKAMRDLILDKKRILAETIYEDAQALAETAYKVASPHTNIKYVEPNWKLLIEHYDKIEYKMKSTSLILKEAESVIGKKGM
mgnify:CR=1 FL=1